MLVESFHLILHVCILWNLLRPILIDCVNEPLCVDWFGGLRDRFHKGTLRLTLPSSANVDIDVELFPVCISSGCCPLARRSHVHRRPQVDTVHLIHFVVRDLLFNVVVS